MDDRLIDFLWQSLGGHPMEYVHKARAYVRILFPNKPERLAFLLSLIDEVRFEDNIPMEDIIEIWKKGSAVQ